MQGIDNKKLLESVIKKAAGYESVETQEEYSLIEGEMTLTKRKITTKDIPPDITALKLLLGDEQPEQVTREDIERERKALTEEFMRRLAEKNKNSKKR